MMEVSEQRSIIEKYVNAYNNYDIEAMMSVIHNEIEFVNLSGGEVNATASGIDEFRNLAEETKDFFSSRKQTILDFNEKDDQAAIEVEYEGILAADLHNGMKAGEIISLQGHSEFTFRDGKIYRIVDMS